MATNETEDSLVVENWYHTVHDVKPVTAELLDTRVSRRPFSYLLPRQSSDSNKKTVEGEYVNMSINQGINEEYGLSCSKIIALLSIESH